VTLHAENLRIMLKMRFGGSCCGVADIQVLCDVTLGHCTGGS